MYDKQSLEMLVRQHLLLG